MNAASEINRYGILVYVKPTKTINFEVCFCSFGDFFVILGEKEKKSKNFRQHNLRRMSYKIYLQESWELSLAESHTQENY